MRSEVVDSLVKAALFKNHYKDLKGEDKAKVDARAEKELKKNQSGTVKAYTAGGGLVGGVLARRAAAPHRARKEAAIKNKAAIAAEKNAYATKSKVDHKAAKGSFIPKGKKTAADYIAQGKTRDTKIKNAAKGALRKVKAKNAAVVGAGIAAGAVGGALDGKMDNAFWEKSHRNTYRKAEAKKLVKEQEKANKS